MMLGQIPQNCIDAVLWHMQPRTPFETFRHMILGLAKNKWQRRRAG